MKTELTIKEDLVSLRGECISETEFIDRVATMIIVYEQEIDGLAHECKELKKSLEFALYNT